MPLPEESFFGRIGVDPPPVPTPRALDNVARVRVVLLRVGKVRTQLKERDPNDPRP